MRLLVLAPVVPDAPSDGDRLRLFHWLERLSHRHEIHLACLDVSGAAGASSVPPAGTASVRRFPRGVWDRRLAAALALAGPWPVSVAADSDAGMRRWIDALARNGPRFDAVLAYRLKMAPYALRWRGPRFLDYTDSMTRVAEREAAAHVASGRPLAAAFAQAQARRLAALEAFCAVQFDGGFFNACGDRDAVAAMAPQAAGRLLVAANGVDAAGFAPPPANRRDPRSMVFVGNLAYRPNSEAVEWFVERVLPRVLRGQPGARLSVAGGGAPSRLARLAGRPGVRFLGFVPDTRPLLWGAGVGLCPVLGGAGRQNKLLEAFAAGLPSVATPLAAEGAEADDGRHLLVARDPEAFAAAVLRLMAPGSPGPALARRALALVRSSYDWDRNVRVLEGSLLAGARRRAW